MFNIENIFMWLVLVMFFYDLFYHYKLEQRERAIIESKKELKEEFKRLKELEKGVSQTPELTPEYIESLYWEDGLTMDERGTNLLKMGNVLIDMVFKVKDCDVTEFHAVLLYHENTYWLYEYEKHSGNDDFTALCLYPLNECRTDLRAFNRIKSSNV